MKKESYIVEGCNWKCRVNFEKNLYKDNDFILVEAATQCFEFLFNNTHPKSNSVDIFELKDENGIDFFKETEIEKVPDPAFGLLTKIYKIKDVKNTDEHYFIKTRTLMENASIHEAITLVKELEIETKKTNPSLFKNVYGLMKNRLVFKMGDLRKI